MTPRAQVRGKLVRRFVAGQRLSEQSIKIVNWRDTLLSGKFLDGRRTGVLRMKQSDWLRALIHQSRIAGRRRRPAPPARRGVVYGVSRE